MRSEQETLPILYEPRSIPGKTSPATINRRTAPITRPMPYPLEVRVHSDPHPRNFPLGMGGVPLIDEAHYLYRPENERDYGQEAIEILLQVMENQGDDLVVIRAGYRDRMDTFFRSNPGLSSRVDRARLHRANRLFAQRSRQLTRDEFMTIAGQDLRASRVFSC